jgi:hypothetical protein
LSAGSGSRSAKLPTIIGKKFFIPYFKNSTYLTTILHIYLDHGLLLQLKKVQLEIVALSLFETEQEKQCNDQNCLEKDDIPSRLHT